MILLYEDKCQGCSLCVEVCPKKILTVDHSRVNVRGYAPIRITDESSCINCAICAMMCPDCVIEIRR